MKINTRFLQANIGIIAGIIAFLFSFFLSSIISINPIILLSAILVCLFLNRVAFEYQRITLTIGRCLKIDETTNNRLGVADIQMMLSSSTLGFLLFLESILFGLVLGYLFGVNVVYSILLFLVKYIGLGFIPTPVPHKLLFRIIDKQIVVAGRELMEFDGAESMVKLIMIYKKMPHSKHYEKWAFEQYGNDLLHQKL